MSESTAPLLPLDIVENIIEILVDDAKGRQYVKAFSLTCRSFLPFCRKHIFSSISIAIGGAKPSIQPTPEAFECFLLEVPAIAKYIRQLAICVGQQPPSESEHFFDQVTRQLTGLESLTVSFSFTYNASNWTAYQASTYWNNISSSIQHSLLNLMHLPTLRRLNLRTIKFFPISNLITCTNLKHLSVKDLEVSGEHDVAVSPLLHKSMQLQSLDIKITGWETPALLAARCPHGRPVIDFTSLKKISVSFTGSWREAAVPTREIFRKARGLLDISLHADDADFEPLEVTEMIRPSLQKLKRLELGIFNATHTQDPLAAICDDLEHISGNNLESLDIQVVLDTDEDCRTGAEWGRLEKVLLQPGWPMLKHVSLLILFNSGDESRIDGPFGMALKSLPQTQFIGLMSSNILDFKFSVKEFCSLQSHCLGYDFDARQT